MSEKRLFDAAAYRDLGSGSEEVETAKEGIADRRDASILERNFVG